MSQLPAKSLVSFDLRLLIYSQMTVAFCIICHIPSTFVDSTYCSILLTPWGRQEGLGLRKQAIWVSNQVQHEVACTVSDEDFVFKKRNCTFLETKTRRLINCVAVAQQVCAFVFTYACCWFSYAEAQVFDDNRPILLLISP